MVAVALLGAALGHAVRVGADEPGAPRFRNPSIRSGFGSDENLIAVGGMYYLLENQSYDGAFWVYRAPTLTGLDNGTKTKIWTAPACHPGTSPANSCELWQPELHYVAGSWYVYYAADDGPVQSGFNPNHRIFALKGGSDPTNPLSAKFRDVGAVANMPAEAAIDPTIVHTSADCGSDPAGDYLLWGALTQTPSEELHLARLTTPTAIDASQVVTISVPAPGWESAGGGVPIDEGPNVVTHGDRVNVLFSGGDIWTHNYAVGLVSNPGGCVRNASSWVRAPNNPVFQPANGVHAVGTVAIVPSPDGTETWMMYQGEDGTDEKTLRLQPITWNADDTPNLGTPVAATTDVVLPAGEIAPWGWGDAPNCADTASTCGMSGQWSFPNLRDATLGSVGGAPQQTFFPAAANGAYWFDVNLRYGGLTGISSATPTYGVYGWYLDPGDFVRVAIAPGTDTLRFDATIGAVAQPPIAAPLPSTFRPQGPHHLRVSRRVVAGHGVFDVQLDHKKITALTGVDLGAPAAASGVVGLTTDDETASYTNLQLVPAKKPWAWGDVPNDVFRVGAWTSRAATLTSDQFAGSGVGFCYTGHPPGAIYRTDTSLVDYTLTTWVRMNSEQCTDKFGVKMSDRDNDTNSVLVYIDAYAKTVYIYTHIDGDGAAAATVPVTFDPSVFNQLRVTKRGAAFTVALNGATVATANIPRFTSVAGSFGLWTDLADVTFGKSANAPALRID